MEHIKQMEPVQEIQTPKSPIKVVGKIGQVLDAFLVQGPELHLQEIANVSGLDLSTVSRLANSLVDIGLLRFDRVQRIYTPGLIFLEMSRAVLNRFSFREITHREMLSLSVLSGWQCNLAVLDERDRSDIVYIDVTSTTRDPYERSPIGQRRRAHTTASGLVLLAFNHAAPQSIETMDAAGNNSDRLDSILQETRDRGYAIIRGNDQQKYWSISAPLFGPDGSVVAALGTGTDSRDDFIDREETMTAAIVDTARGISSAMRLSGGTSMGF